MKLVFTVCTLYAGGCAAGGLAVIIYNRLPARWFCDYGEQPDEAHVRGRIPYKYGKICAVLLSGFLSCFVYAAYGFSAEFFLFYAFCLIFEFTAFADIRYGIIPDEFVIASAVLAAAAAVKSCSLCVCLSALWGAVCAAALIFAVNLIGRLIYKQDAMGMGDVKLFAAAGLAVGFPGVFTAFFIMLFSAGIGFAVLAAAKKLRHGDCKPLGPYICAASAALLCFGEYIEKFTAWYIALLK